ncbi:MAG: hypothetical protein ACD_22C00115G0003 [uncultured bacterium]|uniref:Uncharacterized protein n=1 Tax=candidate division WWE3 bacterium TaxID=2053526 RepID=A0A656PLU0_UNCKA|nr:hypothetical protein P147_WWE3C00001G0891 [candidate division WWE3 bacterium RAAC2_WWE3_1]EKD99992.1 MAG: hypothetical protein ACD_22C00115G0003 [uncultured bacterium]KKS29496.1 MAG: hypothetical protein UU91_C0005G0028 [candidate division WWE3 bacterium GW2011_GWB1_42_117]KKS54898.1 MAG: hypothetical protein UV21_C0004G0063 [candidate division WWE3 bacterium GW2011_GWD2_42_34]KKT05514.1 MAG: hypothetical protein UV83_C0003G0069 [candidate division WWE3 bacterium GW2011_GWE2_43_18]KKT06733.
MNKLPVYKGHTVDFRLKEFRKAIFGKALEFVPFESEEGQKLIAGFLATPEGKLVARLQT